MQYLIAEEYGSERGTGQVITSESAEETFRAGSSRARIHEHSEFRAGIAREVGTTPLQYVLQTRVEAVRRQLERTERGLKQVASTAGFGNVDVMRRTFVRLLGITPRRYRELAQHSNVEGGNTGVELHPVLDKRHSRTLI
jgi:methylphosphotriester-DNA--protein-cysteine methyltransferase